MTLWVLYENSRNTRTTEFGPHVLLCACVGDALGMEWYVVGGGGDYDEGSPTT